MIPHTLWRKARICGDDGFYMLRYVHLAEKEPFVKLLDMLGAKVNSTMMSNNQVRYYDHKILEQKFIKYLKTFCSASFGVASMPMRPQEEDDYAQKVEFYIAFREKKDLFKFALRFGGDRTRWWRSGLSFTIIGEDGDPYVFANAGDKWNKEDPHGYIRP